jgi:hypothetical protein
MEKEQKSYKNVPFGNVLYRFCLLWRDHQMAYILLPPPILAEGNPE